MRGKFDRSQAGDERSVGEETEAHEDLFHEGAGGDFEYAACRAPVKPPGRVGAQRQHTGRCRAQDGGERHAEGDEGADRRCDGRTARCKPRKKPYAVDEKIVKYQIHEVCGYVGTHADLRVAEAALRGIDRHAEAGEKLPAHNNAVVFHAKVDEIRLCARKRKQFAGKEERTCDHQDAEKQAEHERLFQRTACAVNVAFTLAAGDDGRNACVECDDGRHQQKTRLGRDADG